MHFGGAGPFEGAGAGIQRGAGGENIIDQQDFTAFDSWRRMGWDLKRPEHVAPPRLGRRSILPSAA